MKSSAGGRKLQVELEERGCIEYQLHMIEENPELKIAEVIHVSRIDRDCFLCDVGGYFSLSDTVLRKEKSLDIVDLIDRILRLVKLGEEHMLERGKYILDPECVFISPEGELLLTYVPCSYEMERDFAADMLYLCRFIRENCCDCANAYSSELESIFEDGSCDTKDYIKYIYRYKDMDSEYDSADQKELSVNKVRDKKKNGKDKKKNVGKRRGNIIRYVVTLISFVIFMVVFWVGIMSITNMAGIFLVLVGINVLVYGVGNGNGDEEDPDKKIRRAEKGKKKSEAVLFKRGSGRRKENSVLSLKR